ncbi:hypothetical protein GOP97_19205 [Vibrio cholerae]|uniref:hypothetical protein n=1 Tax=Vibrio cholerae TaxID=666 RepID=UPI0028766B9D|nr:hypothetical protein [Vibrio cholerae]ELE7615365.1 hypothetical protein [Vibrio vulnificus]MEB5557848.1 hypothetical protein [Vibrio cholerae]
MTKINRSISEKDTSLLITNAGGRCSFNYNGNFCNKILSDGRVNLGERAHIIGVKGPRAEFPTSNLNGYDNLMWMCKEHHTIIDHPSNLNVFTVQALREMKFRHEEKIRTGRYPYYGTATSIHDYSSLSTLFLFLNIHSLYGNIAMYPMVHIDFYDVEEAYKAYCQDNPPELQLYDPLLRERFNCFLTRYYDLANHIRFQPNTSEDQLTGWHKKSYDDNGYFKVVAYLESVEALITIIGQRFPQILQQEIYQYFSDDT